MTAGFRSGSWSFTSTRGDFSQFSAIPERSPMKQPRNPRPGGSVSEALVDGIVAGRRAVRSDDGHARRIQVRAIFKAAQCGPRTGGADLWEVLAHRPVPPRIVEFGTDRLGSHAAVRPVRWPRQAAHARRRWKAGEPGIGSGECRDERDGDRCGDTRGTANHSQGAILIRRAPWLRRPCAARLTFASSIMPPSIPPQTRYRSSCPPKR
jgi:hypothetical protein